MPLLLRSRKARSVQVRAGQMRSRKVRPGQDRAVQVRKARRTLHSSGSGSASGCSGRSADSGSCRSGAAVGSGARRSDRSGEQVTAIS